MPRSHSVLVALLLVVTSLGAAACTHDYGELTDGALDGAADTSPIDAGDGGDAAAMDAARDTTPGDTATDTMVDSAVDTSVDAGLCGELGQRCCSATPCAAGACLEGVCVAFAGAFQVDESGGCEVENPLFGDRCGCPPGFVDQALMPMDARNSGSGELETLRVCHAPADAEGADFRGAFGRQEAVPTGCESACVANPATASCACPSGTGRGVANGVHDGTSADSCWRNNNLCIDTAARALTFGGAFQAFDTGIGADCDNPPGACMANPATDECACPDGFASLDFPFMKLDGSQLAEDLVGACPATFHVCWRSPPPPD